IAIATFLETASEDTDKMVILTTSGSGRFKLEEVDAITGASITENIPEITGQLIDRIESVMQ
ncbi:MAG: hypothetical protein AAFQ37_14870, partial [Bacteroidota bacterium]